MNNEIYLNHPTFGLLYRVCLLDEDQVNFYDTVRSTSIFLVKLRANRVSFEPISRSDARLLVETRLRHLRRTASVEDYQELHNIYQLTFQ